LQALLPPEPTEILPQQISPQQISGVKAILPQQISPVRAEGPLSAKAATHLGLHSPTVLAPAR
jgi:hypothetical protein